MRTGVYRPAAYIPLIIFTFGTSLLWSQTGVPPAKSFNSHVYAWLSDNRVIRLSPGPLASPTAAMPAGPFAQAHVHPEGSSAVFWGGLDGKPRVWLYQFTSGVLRPLTDPDSGSIEPAFDFAGERIAFARDVGDPSVILNGVRVWRRSDSNIFVMSADGASVRQVTRGTFQDGRPAFSPDGKQIVFLSNRGGDRRGLYLVSSDGSGEPRRLLKESGFARPYFSIDGKFIYVTYFGSEPSFVPAEHTRVWRVALETGTREPVTPDDMPNSQGVFVDHDGMHLWFHSDTAYRFNVLTHELARMTPAGFKQVWHMTGSRNGIRTFDANAMEAPK